MGFQHVELCVLGHLHRTRPLERPPVRALRALAQLARARTKKGIKLWAAETRPGTGAAQTWYSALPVAGTRAPGSPTARSTGCNAASRKDQPFCAWVSFPDPHHAFDCPEPWSLMYDPKDMMLPKHRTRDLERRPWWHKASLEGTPQLADPAMLKFRAEGSRVPDQTDAQLAEMTANYYGMISLIDHNVGRILSALDDLGLADNTLVVYTTDHGELLGNHGLYLKGPTPYEDLLRVTMVARGPGVAAGSWWSSRCRRSISRRRSTNSPASRAAHDAEPQPAEAACAAVRETRDVAYSEWHVHPSRCGVALKLRTVRTQEPSAPSSSNRARASSTISSTIRTKWTTSSTIRVMRRCAAKCTT